MSLPNNWRQAEGGLGGLAARFKAPRAERQEYTESVSSQTPIASTNKGFKLLSKMGWKEDTGLGKQEQGRVEPIQPTDSDGQLGLGKQKEYDDSVVEATATRTMLKVEKMQFETSEMKQEREEMEAKQQDIKNAVKEQNKEFYCSLCRKQYSTVMEWEEHCSSYAHNHRKRFATTIRETTVRKRSRFSSKRAEAEERLLIEAQMKAAQAIEARHAQKKAKTFPSEPLPNGKASLGSDSNASSSASSSSSSSLSSLSSSSSSSSSSASSSSSSSKPSISNSHPPLSDAPYNPYSMSYPTTYDPYAPYNPYSTSQNYQPTFDMFQTTDLETRSNLEVRGKGTNGTGTGTDTTVKEEPTVKVEAVKPPSTKVAFSMSKTAPPKGRLGSLGFNFSGKKPPK